MAKSLHSIALLCFRQHQQVRQPLLQNLHLNAAAGHSNAISTYHPYRYVSSKISRSQISHAVTINKFDIEKPRLQAEDAYTL
eukprot:scaffold200098_cov39-Prasinocladus_malaysianus.AAC.2